MSSTIVTPKNNFITQAIKVNEPIVSAAQGPQGPQGLQGIQGPPGIATGELSYNDLVDTPVIPNLALVSESIVPTLDITFDLGSRDFRFRDLFLSGNTIDLGGQTISASAEGIVLPTGSSVGGIGLGTITIKGARESFELLPTDSLSGDGYIIDVNLWVWNSTDWVDLGAIRGPKGDTGAPGAQGTGITILGSLATIDDLNILSGPFNSGDGYIISSTQHLNMWDGAAWNDVGAIAGPQGIPGVAGPQGPTGPRGFSGASSILEATDVDTTELVDGALLVYNMSTAKWRATKNLANQIVECGQY